MIDLTQIDRRALSSQPYDWAFVGNIFAPSDAVALATSFPRDHFKTVKGYDGEKGYVYEARALINMGSDAPSEADSLSPAWLRLAHNLLSPAYRTTMAQMTGCNLTTSPMEVNVFHYGPSAWLGPHVDLKEKIVTHVFYFNEQWNQDDGGSLIILRSSDMSDAVACIEPIVGNSAVLIRSEKSWHAVSPVAEGCPHSRRSMTVTFYSPGSISTMWPPDDTTPLHHYNEGHNDDVKNSVPGLWARLRRKLAF